MADYFIPLPGSTPPSFKSTTLILPQPSLGSLPQLALDLITHSPSFTLVGYLGLEDHIPSISSLDSLPSQPRPPASSISYAVQVFYAAKSNVTVVLPRSPVVRARKANYLESMREWIQHNGVGEVLVIGSVDAGLRGDEALSLETPLRTILVPTSVSTPLITKLATLVTYSPPSSTDSSPKIPPIPSGGLTRKLIDALSPLSSTIPISALLIFAAEGSNTDQAKGLATAVAELVGVEKETDTWEEPRSWENGLMGEELGRARVGELYG
ncbi:proteasome assembly chaperone 2 [Pseudohyphozyma bogoriensis]|nr:proteasome assembly chaperone 2 [Pseudohyphozyma bogoriensis]